MQALLGRVVAGEVPLAAVLRWQARAWGAAEQPRPPRGDEGPALHAPRCCVWDHPAGYRQVERKVGTLYALASSVVRLQPQALFLGVGAQEASLGMTFNRQDRFSMVEGKGQKQPSVDDCARWRLWEGLHGSGPP